MKQSEDWKELQESFTKFARRNTGWWYLLFIMVILFGVVSLYNVFNNRTKSPADTYHEEFIQMKEKLDSQEERIQQLEEQVKALQDKQ